jgi:hypothetical protein
MADPTYEELLTASENAKRQGKTDAAKKLLDAAVKARRAAPAASPEAALEAKLPTTMQIEESIANVNARQQPFLDALTMFQRGLSFGQSPNIQGAASALTGGSFLEGREAQLAREQAASENLTVSGVPLGMLPEAAGGYGLAKSVMAPLEAAYPTLQGWLGTLLTGGAEGTIYAQGQGQDTTLGALTGAGGGALGRGVATLASKGADLLPSLSPQVRGAERLQEVAVKAGIPKEDFIPTIESELARLGPDAALADVDVLRPYVKGSLTTMSSPEAMASAYQLATSPNRNISDLAIMAWDEIFPTPRTVNALGEAKKLTLDEARTIYETGLNNSRVKLKGAPIAAMVKDAFGERPIGNALTAKNTILRFINGKTPIGPDGKTRLPMTPRDLLEVKESIDQLTRPAPGSAVDKKVNRQLFDLSAKINEQIKDYVPEVRKAADIYSGQYSFDAAYGEGYDLGAAGLKGQSLDDLRETVATFTPSQKAAFAEGWRKAKFESADRKGFEAQFKRVGPTKSNAELEIIDTLFGPGTGEKFADVSNRLGALETTNKQFERQWESVIEATAKPKGPLLDTVRQAADLSVLASQLAQNKVLGGAFQGAFGRSARAEGAQQAATSGDQIINWLTRTGQTPQTAEDAMREIQQYLTMSRPAPLPANLGAQAGRMGAAFERSGR